jgi:multicomponent K+:H+ antiporter subunit E
MNDPGARAGRGDRVNAVSRWLPHPLLSCLLAAVWLFLVNSVAPGQVILGVVLGLAIPAFTRLFWQRPPRVFRYGPAFRLVPLFLFDVVVANITVAALILNFRRRLRPAWIVIPLDIVDHYAIVTLGSMITLTPGTVTSKVTPDRRKLLVHVVDTADPAAEVRRIKERYEKPLKEIFEC